MVHQVLLTVDNERNHGCQMKPISVMFHPLTRQVQISPGLNNDDDAISVKIPAGLNSSSATLKAVGVDTATGRNISTSWATFHLYEQPSAVNVTVMNQESMQELASDERM